ncbi:MAG: HU family DNA-binding protein, partial [Gammaproteobacteria bacterium]|nr:HU family DNA-binding protein [Gammaproteobacteria bacterium]
MPRVTAAATRKVTAVKEPFTKTQLLSTLADNTGLTKREVSSVLEELSVVIERHVKKRAAGTFTLPGVLKIKTIRKPATKSRKMISPFTGEEITVAAKPA